MNYKILLMCLLLISPIMAYTVNDSTFPTTAYVDRDTGFYMKVDNSTVNESLANLDVFVDILDYDGLPYKSVCKYEDGENCYLWTTNNIGEVRGFFKLGQLDYVGQNYTLVVTIGNAQQTGVFSLAYEPRVLSGNVPYFLVWLKDNSILLFFTSIVIVFVFLVLNTIRK